MKKVVLTGGGTAGHVIIERLFDKFGFSYYIDASKPLIDLFPIKFTLNVLNLFLYGFKK